MGIETYLAVQWWLGLVSIALVGISMIISNYPRVKEQSLAMDSLTIILAIAFFAWCSVLRFGIN